MILRGFGFPFGRQGDDHRPKNQVVRSDSGWDIAFIFPILITVKRMAGDRGWHLHYGLDDDIGTDDVFMTMSI